MTDTIKMIEEALTKVQDEQGILIHPEIEKTLLKNIPKVSGKVSSLDRIMGIKAFTHSKWPKDKFIVAPIKEIERIVKGLDSLL